MSEHVFAVMVQAGAAVGVLDFDLDRASLSDRMGRAKVPGDAEVRILAFGELASAGFTLNGVTLDPARLTKVIEHDYRRPPLSTEQFEWLRRHTSYAEAYLCSLTTQSAAGLIALTKAASPRTSVE